MHLITTVICNERTGGEKRGFRLASVQGFRRCTRQRRAGDRKFKAVRPIRARRRCFTCRLRKLGSHAREYRRRRAGPTVQPLLRARPLGCNGHAECASGRKSGRLGFPARLLWGGPPPPSDIWQCVVVSEYCNCPELLLGYRIVPRMLCWKVCQFECRDCLSLAPAGEAVTRLPRPTEPRRAARSMSDGDSRA
jgi:hypothetical protein